MRKPGGGMNYSLQGIEGNVVLLSRHNVNNKFVSGTYSCFSHARLSDDGVPESGCYGFQAADTLLTRGLAANTIVVVFHVD